MKAVVLMYDSLNRHLLPPYAPQTFVHAPNFARLAERSVTFDKSYVCSMPCMPARRDFHTGRPNFLHSGWGPLEPFDDSMPQMLRDAGVYTHLATDHYHYFEDGGATYHNRYSSYQAFRGQEGDPAVGQVADPVVPDHINGKGRRQDWVNRAHFKTDSAHPQTLTLDAGVEFLDRNHDQDRWMLQIETFDPHEPFTCDPKYREHYLSDYDGPLFDWPGYHAVKETPEQVGEARRNYAALMTKCDESLGRVLDAFDRHGLWQDTLLIVWTDHGFMLGEHGCWAKNWMPLFEEVSHTPFFVYDPRHADTGGQRRSALVQPAIDLAPTLLNFFGLEATPRMLGQDLSPVLQNDHAVRDSAIFGYFANRINVTDGRHVLYSAARANASRPEAAEHCYRYTLMPTTMRGYPGNLDQATLHPPFSFTQNMPQLRFPVDTISAETADHPADADLLFDLENDPGQTTPIEDVTLRDQMREHLAHLMKTCDAPPEQFERMGLLATN
ncbi:MAG: sulfatase [Planctomycetota bacterium]